MSFVCSYVTFFIENDTFPLVNIMLSSFSSASELIIII